MKFRLELDVKKSSRRISHHDRILMMGSCFTENIGQRLREYKFEVMENPNGILFNPVSVAEAVTSYIDNEVQDAAQLFQFNELWHSWKHHSRFSAVAQEDAITRINEARTNAHSCLKSADILFITLGSAWTYELTTDAPGSMAGGVAANNHKAPANWFARKLLTVENVLHVLDNMIHRLFRFNPELQIVFTISPVRHLREGLIENNRSKAVLNLAVHHLVDKFTGLHYFPAYELVIDDLRDYRYFAEDLVHPNYFATNYVWEKLVGSFMDEKTVQLMDQIHGINLAVRHRPIHAGSAQHQQFLSSILAKLKLLQSAHPYLNFDAELRSLSGQIQ